MAPFIFNFRYINPELNIQQTISPIDRPVDRRFGCFFCDTSIEREIVLLVHSVLIGYVVMYYYLHIAWNWSLCEKCLVPLPDWTLCDQWNVCFSASDWYGSVHMAQWKSFRVLPYNRNWCCNDMCYVISPTVFGAPTEKNEKYRPMVPIACELDSRSTLSWAIASYTAIGPVRARLAVSGNKSWAWPQLPPLDYARSQWIGPIQSSIIVKWNWEPAQINWTTISHGQQNANI